jgi:putative transposase
LHPIDVHYGQAGQVLDERARVLTHAHNRHPERFVNKHPRPVALPAEAWINKPQADDAPQAEPEAAA